MSLLARKESRQLSDTTHSIYRTCMSPLADFVAFLPVINHAAAIDITHLNV